MHYCNDRKLYIFLLVHFLVMKSLQRNSAHTRPFWQIWNYINSTIIRFIIIIGGPAKPLHITNYYIMSNVPTSSMPNFMIFLLSSYRIWLFKRYVHILSHCYVTWFVSCYMVLFTGYGFSWGMYILCHCCVICD